MGRWCSRAWIIRVSVSAVILTVTLWLLPTEHVWDALRSLAPIAWFGCLVVFLLGHMVSAMKWRLLIDNGAEVSVMQALRAHFSGLVANLCLPGVAGGDVLRAGLIIRTAADKAQVAVGSLSDRLLDTYVLFGLACAGALVVLGGEGGALRALMQVGSALLVVAVGAVGAIVFLPKLSLPGRVDSFVRLAIASADRLRRSPGRLLACLVMSLAVQTTFVGLNVYLAARSDVGAPAAAWFLGWPLAKLLAIVPVSVAGLGVREASLAAILFPFGAEPARVVAVGLLWQSILFAGGVIGATTLLLVNRIRRK